MDFAAIAWWIYLLAVLAGCGFGVCQSLLLKRAVFTDKPRKWLYAVKLILWAVAFTVIALYSIPLLLAFAVGSSVTMLVLSLYLYRNTRKEER